MESSDSTLGNIITEGESLVNKERQDTLSAQEEKEKTISEQKFVNENTADISSDLEQLNNSLLTKLLLCKFLQTISTDSKADNNQFQSNEPTHLSSDWQNVSKSSGTSFDSAPISLCVTEDNFQDKCVNECNLLNLDTSCNKESDQSPQCNDIPTTSSFSPDSPIPGKEMTAEEMENAEWDMWMEKLKQSDIDVLPANSAEFQPKDEEDDDIDVILLDVRQTISKQREEKQREEVSSPISLSSTIEAPSEVEKKACDEQQFSWFKDLTDDGKQSNWVESLAKQNFTSCEKPTNWLEVLNQNIESDEKQAIAIEPLLSRLENLTKRESSSDDKQSTLLEDLTKQGFLISSVESEKQTTKEVSQIFVAYLKSAIFF